MAIVGGVWKSSGVINLGRNMCCNVSGGRVDGECLKLMSEVVKSV